MKRTIISVISGAVAGAIVTCCITFGFSGNIQKPVNGDVAYTGAQYELTEVENSNEKKVLSVEEIAKKVGPSIVGISSVTTTRTYFGTQTAEGSGSGIILDKNGNIVTNHHVIENASKIMVKLPSGNEYEATVVGSDEKTDIAIIKINAKEELHTATLGNSDEVEVGSLAVAIGNPLAKELFGTVTAGVISGVNRSMTVGQREMTLIQTDAAISPGNSGGALINKYGEVIGINSVKLVTDAAEGLGFAIPMNEALPIMQDLMNYGYVKGRPMIGVSVREITPSIAYYNNLLVEKGLYIMSVTEGSGAEKAGLTRGDIITKIDGQEVTTSAQMNKIRDKYKAGDTIHLTVLRGNVTQSIAVVLTEDLSGKKN